MRRLLLLLAPVLLFAVPARADAACGVPMARAEYETPEVQIYERGNALRACLRATGKERVIGSRYDDGSTSEVDLVGGVFGGRYVWTSFSGSYAESFDVAQATINGGKATITPFMTGFLDSKANTFWGRPVDVLQMPDGSLLVSDEQNGAIYRVTYGKQ